MFSMKEIFFLILQIRIYSLQQFHRINLKADRYKREFFLYLPRCLFIIDAISLLKHYSLKEKKNGNKLFSQIDVWLYYLFH